MSRDGESGTRGIRDAFLTPTVFLLGPFRLFFFSREETRMHVHVSHPAPDKKTGSRFRMRGVFFARLITGSRAIHHRIYSTLYWFIAIACRAWGRNLVYASALAFCPASAFATVLSMQETVAYFGNLNQHSLEYSYPQYGTGSGNVACGPVAGINSLVYLSNRFPNVYGSSLIRVAPADMDNSGSHTAYDDWIYSAGASGMAKYTYMNTTLQNGTWHDNFIRGTYSYIEASVGGVTEYSAQDYWSPTYWGNVPTTRPPPSWVLGQTPSWNFIYDGLTKGSAVGVLFTYTGGGGHFVSVTGMTWDTLTNNGTLAYMNPWTGSAESTNIRLTSGRINTDYGGTNGSWISVANSVIAVPEPSTVMLLFGGSFLVFFGCRRKPPNISGRVFVVGSPSPSDHLESDPPEETENGYDHAESEKWRVDEASNRHDAEIDLPWLHRLRISSTTFRSFFIACSRRPRWRREVGTA